MFVISTSLKVRIAFFLSFLIVFFRQVVGLNAEVIVSRRDLSWSLDLREGIDLSIYIFGGFELNTLHEYTRLVKLGDIILDIGANIGAHTLPLAQLVGKTGRVIAFEPTNYAFSKLKENIALNEEYQHRIGAYQIMLTSKDSDFLPEYVYSSWPLEKNSELHMHHHGRLMATCGASNDSLDNFLEKLNLKHIDFIKLDVDGNEYDVLCGAENTLIKFKPVIIIELAPYVYYETPQIFDLLLHKIWDLGYILFHPKTGKLLPINVATIRDMIPAYAGINVVARHSSSVK